MKRLIPIILSVFLLTGCSGRAEQLEDSAVVRALAVDRGEKGYVVSVYIAGAEEGHVVSAEAESVAEAFLLLNTQTERRIFLGQLRVIAVSAELRNIEEPLIYLYSAENVRSAAKVLIVNGTARDVLEHKGLYREPAADIENLLENAEKNANHMTVTLYGCVNSMASEAACCILPAAKKEEKKLTLQKGAVYRNFRILQTLSEQELAGSAILSEKEKVFLTEGQSSIELSRIRVEKKKGRVSIACSYRIAAEDTETCALRGTVEKSIAEAVRAVCGTMQQVGAEFAWMTENEKNAEITVTARPAGNDYPLKGVGAE